MSGILIKLDGLHVYNNAEGRQHWRGPCFLQVSKDSPQVTRGQYLASLVTLLFVMQTVFYSRDNLEMKRGVPPQVFEEKVQTAPPSRPPHLKPPAGAGLSGQHRESW